MNAKETSVFFLFHGIMLFGVAAATKELTSSRSASFATQENMRLKGHVVKRFNSPSLMSCGHMCLRNSWCASSNFKESSKENDQGTCELNQHGPLAENAEFQDEQGVTYSMFLKGCPVTGCLNGGSCFLDENKQTFRCLCKVPWTGERCENASARSCKDIRDSWDSKGDGEYWIDPENRKKLMKVFCDMATDGGGWLLIANFVSDGSTSFPRWTFNSSYRAISKFTSNNMGIATNAMQDLRSLLNFTQLRFHCSKKLGRTFHVTTVANSSGEAVVQYFSGQTNVLPISCGSFHKMHGDNSNLAAQCERWGHENRYHVGKWGKKNQKRENRLYERAAFVGRKYYWYLREDYWFCDDVTNDTIASPGDFWKIYVR